jgi:serine/threonine-protein kinase
MKSIGCLNFRRSLMAFLPSYEAGTKRRSNLEAWQRLRLVVVHATEVYIPLNLHQSPFNVGLPIRLPELTLEQVQQLVQAYGLSWSTAKTTKLTALVGGHPYLLQLALYHFAKW